MTDPTPGTFFGLPQPQAPDGGGITLALQATLGKVATTQQRLAQALDDAAAQRALQPVAVPQVGNPGIVVAATPTIIDIGGPVSGRQWVVRRWAVADGADITNPITGATSANLYIGRPPQPSQAGIHGKIHEWVDGTATLPTTRTLSSEQGVVYHSDHVFVIVLGASTVGQQILASVMILDMPVTGMTSTIDV